MAVARVTEARAEILATVRSALADVPAAEKPDDVVVPRRYRRSSGAMPADRLKRFAERVTEYGATVRRVDAGAVAAAITDLCCTRAVRRIVVPADFRRDWLPEGIDVVLDVKLTLQEIESVGTALTGCAVASAATGTVMFDGGVGQGRRVLTLLPDHHICVVEQSQIVDLLSEALKRVRASARAGQPLTLMSGPSATSDIELTRVEGVHGPRRLDVVIV